MSLLIKGGRVVTAADDYVADLFVEDETIALIGGSLDIRADRVIDATGKYVLPGCIDPHAHISTPFFDTVTVDDFPAGTAAAAFGGTTTILHFCIQAPGQSFPDTLAQWHEKLELENALVDVGFHLGITDFKEGGTLADLARAAEEGVTSFKLYLAYKGVSLHPASEALGESRAPVGCWRPASSRSSRPITAPTTGTARRRAAPTTSRRSRTALRESRIAC